MSAAPAASSAAAASSVSPLEQRLQQTNARIVQLLDQMAGQSNEEQKESCSAPSTASGSAAASTSSAAVPSVSLLSTCRPFDRSAFLAFVSTYSPLVWSHKPSPSLSPLTCARLGWVCLGLPMRDALACGLCRARVDVTISPAVAALPASAEALCSKYAELLATSHANDCPWSGNPYEQSFTQILTGASTTSTAGKATAGAQGKDQRKATEIWIALNQARARASTLHDYAAMDLQEAFVEKVRQEANRAGVTVDSLSTPTILALCGWEHRSSTSSDAASSAAAGQPSPLQCWFGCREVPVEQYFTAEAESVAVEIQPEEAEEEEEEKKEEAAGEEEEERSIFQSPIKRRKLDSTTAAVASSHHPSSHSTDVASSASQQPIRTSAIGFDPSRAHRPFCPFVSPLPTSDAQAASNAASAVAPSRSASSTKYSPAAVDEHADEEVLGWQHLLRWWLERLGKLTRQPRKAGGDDDITMSNEEQSLAPPNLSSASAARPMSKAQRYGAVVETVKRLLSDSVNAASTALKRGIDRV